MNLRFYVVLFSCLFLGVGARCQKVAVKSNLLYDATATINLGIEFCLAPKWTFDVSGNYNGWTFSGDRKWKHCLVQPEARYWFCDRFAGHFLGAHLLGGQFNIGGVKNHIHFLGSDFSQVGYRRYQGWMIGAGVAYGYAWILGKHWNVEGEIGLGWIYTRYDSYPCANCGKKLAKNKTHNYVGPTKAAVNLVYTF